MGFKSESGTFHDGELLSVLKRYGVEPPEEIQLPCTFKLDEKFALHLAERGLGLVSGQYVQRYSYVVTKNQVVQLEKD